jgi:acetyltransferase
VDKHYLNPLFCPDSIVVFAGDPALAPEHATRSTQARALLDALAAGGFKGTIAYLDIAMTGTLADLAASRADLAIIALPPEQIAAALEVAGRIRARAALVISAGLDGEHCAKLHAIAKRAGMLLLGPTAWASSGRRSA